MVMAPLDAEIAPLLPTPKELHQEMPLNQTSASFILRSRATVHAILSGHDPRLLLIVGPCSIHDPLAALEYGEKLRGLSDQISDRFFVVMRTYFEKPRTITGWKGMLYDPDLDGSYQLEKGIRQTRKLLLELSRMGIPAGSELLEINTFYYYADFLTWGCIGTRTCSSPPHRQMASQLNFPIGFKNSPDGNVDPAIHGILAAATPQAYLGFSKIGQMSRIMTEGNPFCHIVLRGGNKGPNYDFVAIQSAFKKCQHAKIPSKLLIDCSHDNSRKKPEAQYEVLFSCLQQVMGGNRAIGGWMLESHLNGGSQEIAFPLNYGVSITDPCLDWETTKLALLEAHHFLRGL